MISLCRSRLTLVGCLMLYLPCLAQAQADSQPSRTTVWLGGGYGLGWSTGFPRDENAWSLNVSGQRGSLLLSTRVAAVTESAGETNWDIGVLGGLASSPAYPVHGGVALGLGYAETQPSERRVGVPAELQLFWRFSRVAGVGAYVFGDLGADSFYGATLGFQVGRLR